MNGSAYIICTLPRSGSTGLADLLCQTGIAGVPREYLSRPERFVADSRVGYESFFPHLLKIGSTANGIFGAKIFWFQIAQLAEMLARTPPYSRLSFDDALNQLFPRLSYIWLRRRDKLRQAISYYRASETNIWSTRRRFPTHLETCQFDREKIEYWRRRIIEWDQGWSQFFEARSISPLTIVYEDMVGNWYKRVTEIVHFIEASYTGRRTFRLRYARQSDALTDKWVKLFDEPSTDGHYL